MMEWPSHQEEGGGTAPRPTADGAQPSGRPSRSQSCRPRSRPARCGGRSAGRPQRSKAGPLAGPCADQAAPGGTRDALAGPHAPGSSVEGTRLLQALVGILLVIVKEHPAPAELDLGGARLHSLRTKAAAILRQVRGLR
eukprot:2459581-Alexandrium_andersonii.AAC.1